MKTMPPIRATGLRAALGFALAVSLFPAAAQSADLAVARLGAVTISQAEVERLLQAMPEGERAQVKANRAGLDLWLRQRLASEALLREAQQKQWAERPEIKAQIDAAVHDVRNRIVSRSYLESQLQVPTTYPTDADLATAYEQAKPQLQLPALHRVAQIYLATPPEADAAAIERVRAQAAGLAEQARRGDFAALAKAHSQDARSAAQGGEVGILPLAQLLPEMHDPVAGLQPGQVSEPVRSPSGFHVLKLLASQPARLATLEEARPRLQAALRERRKQEMLNDYLIRLAPPGSVSIDSAALDAALQKVP